LLKPIRAGRYQNKPEIQNATVKLKRTPSQFDSWLKRVPRKK
jgi:hypothetical protein